MSSTTVRYRGETAALCPFSRSSTVCTTGPGPRCSGCRYCDDRDSAAAAAGVSRDSPSLPGNVPNTESRYQENTNINVSKYQDQNQGKETGYDVSTCSVADLLRLLRDDGYQSRRGRLAEQILDEVPDINTPGADWIAWRAADAVLMNVLEYSRLMAIIASWQSKRRRGAMQNPGAYFNSSIDRELPYAWKIAMNKAIGMMQGGD